MGSILSKCSCTSAASEREVPLQPSNVEISITTSNDGNDLRGLQAGQEKVSSEEPKSLKMSYQLFVLETLNRYRQENRFTDFTIRVNGKNFPVHRNVLAASSNFFSDLFSESDSSQPTDCEFEKVDPSTMENILNILYTGKCKLDELNNLSVLSLAETLGVQELFTKFAELLQGNKISVTKLRVLNSNNQDAVLTRLSSFQTKGLFCDVTLTTRSGKVVPVHKNVLAAVSCYFEGLFRSEMREVHEKNVDFGVIDETVVEELLNFVYIGEINISFHNARNLLQASDYLLIEHLKRRIIDFVKDSSTLLNFWLVYSLVRSFDCLDEVYQEMVNFVSIHFWSIAHSSEFLCITEQDVRWFLSNDDILSSEAQMLECLIRWYRHSLEDRKESFRRLLNLIHMGSIPDQYLKRLVADQGIDELTRFSGYRLDDDVPIEDILKTSAYHNVVLFGLTHRLHYTHSYNLCYWLPFAGPWSLIARIPHNKSMLANGTPLVYTSSGLYVQVPWNNPKLAFHRNPLTARHLMPNSGVAPTTDIEPSAPMTFDCAAVTMGKFIYLIGGMSMQEVTEVKTVQRYDVEKQTWSPVADMLEPRYELSAVNFKNRYIFVFGGTDGSSHRECLKTVERYDPHIDRWSYVSSMHQPRSSAFAFVHNEKIYVIGGERGEDVIPTDCELYDPVTDDWQVARVQVNTLYMPKGQTEQGSFLYHPTTENRELNAGCAGGLSVLSSTTAQQDQEGRLDEAKITRPYVTCINGSIVILDFSTCADGQRRADFYFVDPDSGNFRILQSLFAWPTDISYGAVMPLSRRDMMKALKDYSVHDGSIDNL
ncbi:kelch-like protein 12 [Montipora capricornis]|uniref:kelch-like protein 12 n=1 Tax=Montipora capricornis TaxID=246305 RepID=UPI0035F19BE8